MVVENLGWKEFLKLNRGKVLISLGVALSFYLFRFLNTLLTYPDATLIRPINYTSLPDSLIILLVYAISILLNAILFYPFSCSLYFLYQGFREKRFRKVIRIKKVLFSLIFLNPISIATIPLVLLFIKIALGPHMQCGVYIAEVLPNSYAGEIGLQEKTVIVGINGKPVRNVSEFQRILDTLENDQEVSITWSREGRWYGGQNIKVKKPLGVKIGTYTPLEGSWECDQISLFEKELKQSQA